MNSSLTGRKDILLALSQPLGHEVRGGDGEEGGVVGLRGHGLGQVRLPCSWRTEQKDSSPRSPFALRRQNELEMTQPCLPLHTDGLVEVVSPVKR